MNNPINNQVFDTRDLIDYLSDLEQDLIINWNDYIEDHNLNLDEDEDEVEEADYIDDIDLHLEGYREKYQDEVEEYEELKSFCEELEDYAVDYQHGETIIHEDYFTEYCEDMVKDCGYISDDLPGWIEINWEDTADNMKVDYTTVEYQGDTYYVR